MKSDGGQAFPCINPSYDGNWDKRGVLQGMSVRQAYKMAALTGILAKSLAPNSLRNHSIHQCEVSSVGASAAAKIAAEYADAMIREDEEAAK